MSFKDISYLQLWPPFCLVEQNHSCKFRRGHYEEHFCKKYFEFRPVVQEMSLKRFFIYSSGSPLFGQAKLCAISEEGIMENIPV